MFAQYLEPTDIHGTDLERVLEDIRARAQQLRDLPRLNWWLPGHRIREILSNQGPIRLPRRSSKSWMADRSAANIPVRASSCAYGPRLQRVFIVAKSLWPKVWPNTAQTCPFVTKIWSHSCA